MDALSAKKKNPLMRSEKRAAKVARDDAARPTVTACFPVTASATQRPNVEPAAQQALVAVVQAVARAARPVSARLVGALAGQAVAAKLHAQTDADAPKARGSQCRALAKVGGTVRPE